jgi:ribosomal protein S18 acetylase RimI-like enzyme
MKPHRWGAGEKLPVPDLQEDSALTLAWSESTEGLDWHELSALYHAAPLGNKNPADLQTVFSNSRFMCLVRDQGRLVGAGRALADGVDCAYLCDVAVLPSHQGTGLGKAIVKRLVALSSGHKKIILYSVPGKEPFYRKLGFRRMCTAMAIFENQAGAFARGYIDEA